MKLQWLLLLAAGSLVAADDGGGASKEREKFAGSWKLVSLEAEGKDEKEEAVFTFAEDKITIAFKDDKKTAVFKLDPSAKPPAIDIIPEDGPEKGKTIKGIYVFEGEKLKLCAASRSDKDRPTDFATKKGSGSILFVLRKGK